MNGSGVFVRDPLSVQFDPMAVRLIDAAVARYAKYPDTPGTRRRGRHERLTAAQEKLERSRWQRGLLVNTLPAVTRETSGDRLSREERAFTRAMYYSPRITTMNPAQHPDAEWSLKIQWDDVPPAFDVVRGFRVRVFTPAEASRWAQSNLRGSESYAARNKRRAAAR
jgi:hypothetical protein